MLMALIPLFDEKMAVKAYSVFSQKDNYFLNPMLLGTGKNDGAPVIEGLEFIESIGLETISEDKEIFVPVGNISIFSDVESQHSEPCHRIVFLLDNTIPPVEAYINRLRELKGMGYKLAVRKLAVSDFGHYAEMMKLMDYVFLNNKKIAIEKARVYFGKLYPHIRLCAGAIDTMEVFEALKVTGGYHLYEGDFYRVPVTKGEHGVAPLKVNYIELLNVVNNEDFDLIEAANVIGRDMALTISLLQMVNRMTVNSGIATIRHAAAMLGQKELKKWINTAVANELYADKPGEVTRLSMIRAKFAERLAGMFGLQDKSEELFLLGLFSVLDVVLDKTMEEALKIVTVDEVIREALVCGKGPYGELYEFMKQYETANWQEVSRRLVLADLSVDKVYDAYVDALKWYKQLI